MTNVSPPSHAAQRGPATAEMTMRALIARHKLLAAGTAVAALIMVALFLAAVLGPRGGIVRDSASCSQWSSSNQTEQQAYGQRYLSEDRTLPGGATGVPAVEAAVNAGCTAAFASDEEDSVTVLDAINKNY